MEHQPPADIEIDRDRESSVIRCSDGLMTVEYADRLEQLGCCELAAGRHVTLDLTAVTQLNRRAIEAVLYLCAEGRVAHRPLTLIGLEAVRCLLAATHRRGAFDPGVLPPHCVDFAGWR